MKKPPFLFIASLLSLFILPEKGVEKLRLCAVGAVAPSWDYAHQKFAHPLSETKELELENKLLRNQLETVKSVLLSQWTLQKEFIDTFDPDINFEGKKAYLSEVLFKQCNAIPARVVFREPTNWSNSLWINVGEKDNELLGRQAIEKDSPVVVGKAIVGVVEEVGKTRSRVRLITDPRFTLSVRVFRGGEQNIALCQKLADVIRLLYLREDLESAPEIARVLQGYQASLPIEKKSIVLAKGELRGASTPFWRTNAQKLKGEGFHLLNGTDQDKIPLIQNGDLLVTTGLDGVFPPDMHVAYVSKVFPLREGDCMIALEAIPIAQDLNYLTHVFVLPKSP